MTQHPVIPLRTTMYAALHSEPVDAPLPAEAALDVDTVVSDLLSSWHNGRALWERRRGHRRSLEMTIQLQPLDEQTEQPCGQAVVVQTRDISAAGFSFLHAEPLAFRKVLAEFTRPDGQVARLVTRLTWCRYRKPGQYESGGRFLADGAVPS